MTRFFSDDEPRPPFIPGLDLAEGFFRELVYPMLDAHMSDVPYSAGEIVGALRKEIVEPSVRAIADRWMIGSIDLFNYNHLLDDDLTLRPLLMALYE